MCTSSAASHDPCLLEGLLWSREDEDHHDWIVDCNATREPNEDDVFKMIPRETMLTKRRMPCQAVMMRESLC